MVGAVVPGFYQAHEDDAKQYRSFDACQVCVLQQVYSPKALYVRDILNCLLLISHFITFTKNKNCWLVTLRSGAFCKHTQKRYTTLLSSAHIGSKVASILSKDVEVKDFGSHCHIDFTLFDRFSKNNGRYYSEAEKQDLVKMKENENNEKKRYARAVENLRLAKIKRQKLAAEKRQREIAQHEEDERQEEIAHQKLVAATVSRAAKRLRKKKKKKALLKKLQELTRRGGDDDSRDDDCAIVGDDDCE